MPFKDIAKERQSARIRSAAYRARNLELVRKKRRDYYWSHRVARLAYSKKYHAENPEVKRNYEKANREKLADQQRQRYARNPERYREISRAWKKAHRESRNRTERNYKARNPSYRLKGILTAQIHRVLARKKLERPKKLINLVGCDVSFFKRYIEHRFLDGMSWENHGKGEGKWHLDHRIPCSRFNLTDPDQRRTAFHYSNIQPMWSKDNQAKYNFLPEPHQAELI